MFDRTVEHASTQMDETDDPEIDAILDEAETALLGVAVDRRLHEPTVERGRWDQPEVVLSWIPARELPHFGKNIRVFVRPEREHVYSCLVESNAWFDQDRSRDAFVRYWKNTRIGWIPIAHLKKTWPTESRWIEEMVRAAYEAVSDAEETVLDQAVEIASGGTATPLRLGLPLRVRDGLIVPVPPAIE